MLIEIRYSPTHRCIVADFGNALGSHWYRCDDHTHFEQALAISAEENPDLRADDTQAPEWATIRAEDWARRREELARRTPRPEIEDLALEDIDLDDLGL